MTAWTIYTNENLFFDQNKNRKLAKKRQSLHFYAMIFWWKKGSLHRNGNAAIPKIKILAFFHTILILFRIQWIYRKLCLRNEPQVFSFWILPTMKQRALNKCKCYNYLLRWLQYREGS